MGQRKRAIWASCDVFGITGEHLKYAGYIIPLLAELLITINAEIRSHTFRIGVAAPACADDIILLSRYAIHIYRSC